MGIVGTVIAGASPHQDETTHANHHGEHTWREHIMEFLFCSFPVFRLFESFVCDVSRDSLISFDTTRRKRSDVSDGRLLTVFNRRSPHLFLQPQNPKTRAKQNLASSLLLSVSDNVVLMIHSLCYIHYSCLNCWNH
jgi:hypothetical protein